MDKQYMLSDIELYGLKIKKIHYAFECCKTNPPTKFIKIIIHHTGNRKTIQEIIDLHVQKNKWSTIGYHFLIDKTGKICYSRELKYAGAHTFGYNKNSIGIALFGNFDKEEPTKKQIESLNELTKALQNNFNIKRILGHNQAIYEKIKKKYWQLKLPGINPLEIHTQNNYEEFIKDTTTKVLGFDASDDTQRLIKRLKTCPGLNTYQTITELQKQRKEQKLEG